jgi:hypothetical protein
MRRSLILDNTIFTWQGLREFFDKNIPKDDGTLVYEDIKATMIRRTAANELEADFTDIAQEIKDNGEKARKGLMFVFDYLLKTSTNQDTLLTLIVKYDFVEADVDAKGVIIGHNYAGHFLMGHATEIKLWLVEYRPAIDKDYLVINLDQETSNIPATE